MPEHTHRDAMIRERKLENVQWPAFRWGRCQSGQDPHTAPAILRLLEQYVSPSHRKTVVLRSEFGWRRRAFHGKAQRSLRAAEISDRADGAIGSWPANESAQIHQS